MAEETKKKKSHHDDDNICICIYLCMCVGDVTVEPLTLLTEAYDELKEDYLAAQQNTTTDDNTDSLWPDVLGPLMARGANFPSLAAAFSNLETYVLDGENTNIRLSETELSLLTTHCCNLRAFELRGTHPAMTPAAFSALVSACPQLERLAFSQLGIDKPVVSTRKVDDTAHSGDTRGRKSHGRKQKRSRSPIKKKSKKS